jgi:alcohol dehydrogenase class IV
MAYNLPAAREDMGNLGRALVVQPGKEDVSPEEAVQAVRELAERIGAPARMREVGVDRAAMGRMAQDAARSPHLAVNPREVQPGDLERIYEEAW